MLGMWDVRMIPFPDKKYKIIYADPPWHFNDRVDTRGVECKYTTLETEQIKNLPIHQISDDNCVLFLWVVYPMLQEGLDVIKAWGFNYKTLGFTWVKKFTTGRYFIGMGNWTRSNTESVLIGVKGKPKRIDAGINQIIDSVPQEHSRKPNIVRERIIQLCGDLPRMELFARTKVHGWDVWGNDEKLQAQPLEAFL